MDVHPAVLAGAHQRVSALSLLRDAFPFRGHAVPIAVVAAAVAPFMAPAQFHPQTFPTRTSVLNVQVKTRPVSFFQEHLASTGYWDFPSEAVPSHEADSIAQTLCLWRPLKALALGTGGRITEALHIARIITLHEGCITGRVDLTQLRSLTFVNCVVTPDDIVVLATRATALTSLQLGMSKTMRPCEFDTVVAKVFVERWQGKLETLMVAPRLLQIDRTIVAAERAAASRHPCAVTSTLKTLTLGVVLPFSQFQIIVAACNPTLRRFRFYGVWGADHPERYEAACGGSVAQSSLEECSPLPDLAAVVRARRQLKRLLRSDPSRAANPPTLAELGLGGKHFSRLSVMPRDGPEHWRSSWLRRSRRPVLQS